LEQVSVVATTQTCITFCAGIFIGPLVDRYGPRKLMLAGVVSVTVGLFASGLAKWFPDFLFCQGVLFGVGVALL
jgi:MFS family permease